MENTQKKIPQLFSLILSPNLYSFMIRLMIGLLMISLNLWLAAGVFSLGEHLLAALMGAWGHEAEKIIIEVVIILAILELVRTLQSYLELGRVKVTLILDAALVVLIGELISLWYRDYTVIEVVMNMGVIAVLTMLRIVTVKYSPEFCNEEDETTINNTDLTTKPS